MWTHSRLLRLRLCAVFSAGYVCLNEHAHSLCSCIRASDPLLLTGRRVLLLLLLLLSSVFPCVYVGEFAIAPNPDTNCVRCQKSFRALLTVLRRSLRDLLCVSDGILAPKLWARDSQRHSKNVPLCVLPHRAIAEQSESSGAYRTCSAPSTTKPILYKVNRIRRIYKYILYCV